MINTILSSDEKFMDYAAKRSAKEVSDNLQLMIKAKKNGKRSNLSEFQLYEIKKNLEQLKDRKEYK